MCSSDHFGPILPVVYRWAYAYGVPGADQDFLPQNMPPDPAVDEHPTEEPRRRLTEPAASQT